MPDFGSATFSQTDGSNNSGTMPSWSGSAAPSTLDDAGRALQGAVTREWNWRSYTLTAGGTADAKTLSYSVAPAAYYNGQRFAFIANTTNTTTATLNVNSLGAKSIRKMIAGTATVLAAGDMVAGSYIEVAYNTSGDYFVWLNGAGVTPQFTSIELGNASDTTITRSAAGVLAVEGGVIPKENRANTFTADQTINDATVGLFLNSNTDYTPQINLTHSGATAGSGPYLVVNRARGTYSSPSIVSSGDIVGSIAFQAYDGTTYRGLAGISAYVDGTPGSSDVPGRLSLLTTPDGSATATERMRIDSSGNILNISSGGLGYGTGSGGTIAQAGSRTTGVTINKTNGSITLLNAPNSTAYRTFTVTNSTVAATDVILLSQRSGVDRQQLLVTFVGAGSFDIAHATVSGTTTEAPIINFAVIKAVTS